MAFITNFKFISVGQTLHLSASSRFQIALMNISNCMTIVSSDQHA